MSTIVQHKRSETSGSVPVANSIAVGEIAVNLADGKMFSKNTAGSIVQLLSYDADLFTVPETVDLGLITDSSSTGSRDLGSIG